MKDLHEVCNRVQRIYSLSAYHEPLCLSEHVVSYTYVRPPLLRSSRSHSSILELFWKTTRIKLQFASRTQSRRSIETPAVRCIIYHLGAPFRLRLRGNAEFLLELCESLHIRLRSASTERVSWSQTSPASRFFKRRRSSLIPKASTNTLFIRWHKHHSVRLRPGVHSSTRDARERSAPLS